MIKAVNQAFCSALSNSFGIYAKFGIPIFPQSPDIEQNSDGSICDFWISGQIPQKTKIVITPEAVIILT